MKNIPLRTISLLFLTLVSNAQNRIEKVPRMVDLTLPAPQESVSSGRGVPGFSNLSPMSLLPVTLNIESIQHATASGKIGVYLVVAVQNLSDKDFELPIGRDVQAITADNRRGRKEFAFLLRALCNKCDRKEIRTLTTTALTSSLPETRIVLKPREQAYIRLFVDTDAFSSSPDEKAVDLQLGCQETELEDGKYFIKSISTKAWLDFSVPRGDAGGPG
jgi:hypothetical protein